MRPRENGNFDGFRLEIDPARERADVILDRAPLNVINPVSLTIFQ